MKSAEYTAAHQGMGTGYAHTLRAQARYFEENQTLRESRHGIKFTLSGILDNEEVMEEVRAWLRTMKPGTVSLVLSCFI
jgi:hypothetical protein